MSFCVHFTKSNIQRTFSWCKNVFVTFCYTKCTQRKMFSTSNLTNVFGAAVFFATSGRTQQKTKAVHYILLRPEGLRKMFSTAVQKCLFAYILRSQMWCQNVFWQTTAFWRTFSKGFLPENFVFASQKLRKCEYLLLSFLLCKKH